MVKSKNCKKNTRNTYIWAKILSHIVVGYLKFMFMLTFISKFHPACHNDANGIKAGSNSKMTGKHAAECSKTAYFGIN